MTSLEPSVYRKLVQEIGELYEYARRTLVKAYWQIGQRIVEVEQSGAAKAPVGERVLQRLSRDLTKAHGGGFSVENLRRMRRFYLANPHQSPATDLTWAQQVELLPIEDPKKRRLLEARALKQGLNRDEVRALVQAEISNGDSSTVPHATPKLLTPVRGRLYTYQIVQKGGVLYVDRGFRNYQMLTPAQGKRFKAGDIVGNTPGESLQIRARASRNDLYTYEAKLDHVYDGDTQWYFIFTDRRTARGMKNDKLRLRGIDCPELSKPGGMAAKKFVEELFRKTVRITVTTTKPDKFDRYLSDVFLEQKDGTEMFLNNELLKHGHARLYGDPKPEDWDD